MECNKEEAIRAKDIAETKMQKKDFAGARRIALKAQQLSPNLENIFQMIAVCNVHCAAENKFVGNELDWYGILQVEQIADEASIKKQYKRLAFQLHPDKNKFAGAEAAFKLIGEAQQMLLDRGKRSLHDMKRRTSSRPTVPSRTPQETSTNSNVGKQATVPHPHQQTQSGFSNDRANFWTSCPFCGVKYNFYIKTLQKSLTCYTCKNPFIAHDIHVQGVQCETKGSRPVFPEKKKFPNQGASDLGPQSTFKNTSYSVNFQGNFGGERSMKVDKHAGPSMKVKGKRRREQIEESNESCDTEDVFNEEAGNFQARQNVPRKSARIKQKVSFQENVNDNYDSASPRKKAKRSEKSCDTYEESGDKSLEGEVSEMNKQASVGANVKDGEKDVKQKERDSAYKSPLKRKKGTEKVTEDELKKSSVDVDNLTASSSSNATRDPGVFEYPDPDFGDFDAEKSTEKLQVGQIWALYSDYDGLPKFYGKIKKIDSCPKLKLHITWLLPSNRQDNMLRWADENMPVCCGRFKISKAKARIYSDTSAFSHQLRADPVGRKNEIAIFPRKGEVWALYKNWNIDIKCSEVEDWEYDIAEVVGINDVRVKILLLERVDGFNSVFKSRVKGGVAVYVDIPRVELLRFSHQIPAFRLKEERGGSLRGFWELDPASVPVLLFCLN